MPGKVKVKILSGRNLPVMDRSSDTTDAYVEIKLGNTTYKTDVCRKSLNPQWNSEWYRFEVDDSELQDEPLQIRLMDHDTYSANDAIGKVYLDLNPLLLPSGPGPVRNTWNTDSVGNTSCCTSSPGGSFMSGWIPVYDTMHGIRGEVNVIVKVELFSDFNKFRQSSCGVQFFCSPVIPQGYHAQVIHGFVEELVVNDDPEYQWIDKIRTPRASNEARQTLFFKLSGEIQRKIGLKAIDLGGNAVIGYCQNFDLEGESGIVARGIGTAVTLTRIRDSSTQFEGNLQNDRATVVGPSRKSMTGSSLNVSNSNLAAMVPPRLREKSPCESRSILKHVESPKKSQAVLLGKRFPRLEKNKGKLRSRNLKIVHPNVQTLLMNEARSHSVERGIHHSEIKRGRSTQSLICTKEPGDHEGGKGDNKFVRGLKAIGFSPKNKLLRKIPALRFKFNSDSSAVEGSESEVDSLSDWSQKDGPTKCETRDKYHRTYSDSSYYGLDRVLEVKESTLSPPGTPRTRDPLKIRDKVFTGGDYDPVEGSSSSRDSSSSESSSSDDEDDESSSSSGSSAKGKSPVVLSYVRRISCKRGTYNKAVPYWNMEKQEEEDENTADGGRVGNDERTQRPSRASVQLTPPAVVNTHVDSCSVDVASNVDAKCPEINVVSYDPETSACSLNPSHSFNNDRIHTYDGGSNISININNSSSSNNINNGNNNSNNLMGKPPLYKSKSATALSGYPSHECESTLSSVLIAPDYKEHGPCLIPSSRNDVDVPERLPAPGTPNTVTHVAPQQHSVVGAKSSHSPAKVSSVPCIHRRSSDSDLSITPKGNSLTGSDRSYGAKESHCRQNSLLVRPSMNQDNLDMLEYPFLTMSKYPPGFIQHLGGTVSARSVKLLERITNLEEPETRDAWWTELRMEVRSHARAMGCNVVVGYSENTSICDDVCVLSASGTAALINFNTSVSENEIPPAQPQQANPRPGTQATHQGKEPMTASLDRAEFEKDSKGTKGIIDKSGDAPAAVNTLSTKARNAGDGSLDVEPVACTVCHIPYSETSVPFRVNMQKCAVCGRGKVPDVLFTTIDLIDSVPTIGKGCFIHAYVCRPKRDCKGEMNAKEISDGLPFLEYELHRLLINKLKVKGMNAIFGLKIQVSIGEKILIGLATGTAAFLTALPSPPVPKISAGNSWKDSKKLAEMQKQLQETVKKSKDFYQIKLITDQDGHTNGRRLSEDTDESDDDYADLDLSLGNKDTCILEVDDAEDADIVSLLIDPTPPEGFYVVSTETVHGLEDLEIVKNLQMFTQVWRAKIPLGQPLSAFNQHFNRLLQSVYFKLRHMAPCALSDLQFKVILEQDEIQLSLLGMALGLGESDLKKKKLKGRLMPSLSRETVKKLDDSDLIFSLEEDSVSQTKTRNRSPVRSKSLLKHTPPRSRYGVDITPLPYVPGGKIERYLGNLNFFFIRESTCIREGGGLGGFIHSFITEVLAIVRAHVTALGGNAMVAYFMSECFLYHYPHKNQGQCLINVGGDVVYISYFPDD